MKEFFKYYFAAFSGSLSALMVSVFVIPIFLITFSVIFSKNDNNDNRVNDDSILYLSLKGELLDFQGDQGSGLDFASELFNKYKKMDLHTLVKVINTAKDDKKIKGIYLDLDHSLGGGFAILKSLRRTLKEFRESGKQIFTYASEMNEKKYYLASVANKIVMPQEGGIEFNGLSLAPIFFKSLLDSLELSPEIFRVGKYKAAVEPFIRTSMSLESRVQSERMLKVIWEEIEVQITKDRGISSERINTLANENIITSANYAFIYNFIDEVKTKSEFLEDIYQYSTGKKYLDVITLKKEDRLTESTLKSILQSPVKYLSKKNKSFSKSKNENLIGVLYLQGEIVHQGSGDGKIDTDNAVKSIRRLAYNPKIKGVVLRINSPGGSALSSDIIAMEIEKLKKIKPVYASFSDMAASGGYYIGAVAEKIYSEKTTITGSIGVFGMVFKTGEFLEKNAKLHFDRLATHKMSDISNTNKIMTSDERSLIQGEVERTYDRFLSVVEKGRKINKSTLREELASGRVWMGEDAFSYSLIDEFGDTSDAIESLAANYNIKDYDVVAYPGENSIEEMIESMFNVKAIEKIIFNLLEDNFPSIKFSKLKGFKYSSGVYARSLMNWDIN